MSENQTVKSPNQEKRNQIINEKIAKIQKDTQELIERTIDGHPASVNVVKVSENKLIIEVDLNEFNLGHNRTKAKLDHIDDSTNQEPSTDQTLNKSTKDDSSHQSLTDQSNVENVDSDGKPILKGILKYSNSWKKRTLSESSFDNSSSFTDHEDDDNNFSLSLSCSDLDCHNGDKLCKKVTFNKQISSKLFSKNQRTIETKSKKKGKRKNLNKKAKGNDAKVCDAKKSSQEQSNARNEINCKSTEVFDKCENVSIDELSFLVCSSSDSDVSNLIDANDSVNNADVSSDSICTDSLENSIENEDENQFSEQKIDHSPLDKENWSEMKSSKKVKKNRKRNDSDNSNSNSVLPTDVVLNIETDFIYTVSDNCQVFTTDDSIDLTYEQHVLRETKCRGVDIVLNSLSKEKLQASIRYLAQHESDALLALPALKNEQSTCSNNFENKFRNSNQDQTMRSVSNLITGLNTFNENLQNLSNLEMTKSITNQNVNTQNLPNQNQMTNQTVISVNASNENSTSTNRNSPIRQKSPNATPTNTIGLSKFSAASVNTNNGSKSNLNELNELNGLKIMELRQSIESVQQTQQKTSTITVNSMKRSPVGSPNNLMEMQQHNSPNYNSENSSINSTPGTSLSSSPIHYSSGYSSVHMLRNSILNEPTISINQSQPSTIPFSHLDNFLSNNANNFFPQEKEDGRPIAIVQGKKNRLNDEDDEVSGTKKFCVNSNCVNGNSEQSQVQSSNQSANSDVRFSGQSHSFGCGLGSLQNNSNSNQNNTAACCSTHEDIKPSQEYRPCVQRHGGVAADFSHLYYFPNRISSPCTASVTPTPQIFNQLLSQSNQFMGDSSNQLIQAQQSQNSSFLFQQHRNPSMCQRTHFQYILSANTSMASKVHEDTMTYLNQGQSYEIKLRKLSGFESQGNILKSVIRVGFQERRLQYMEKDLLTQWKQQRSSERILEIDIPLSYGVFEIIHPDDEINCVEFAWDPNANKELGIFIKLNAISTEFTPKKHGGEKGVPFRLIIETHMYSNNSPISLNTFIEGASCQVKVFKPKGADRKHKTDREKMAKRSTIEQQKYLPSYDCTMFKPCTTEALFHNNNLYNLNQSNVNGETSGESGTNGVNSNFSSGIVNSSTSVDGTSNSENQGELINTNSMYSQDEDCKSNVFMQNQMNSNMDSSDSSNSANQQCNLNNSLANMLTFCSSSCASPFNQMNSVMFAQNSLVNTPLPPNMDAQRVREWLLANRFEKYYSLFQMFNSNDLLNLSRDDLIQICNLTDGIRLYNSLHVKVAQPKTTIYLCMETNLFKACYLSSYKYEEFREKLLRIVSESSNNYDYNVLNTKLKHILMIGPNQIKILVTEDVISNLTKESMYIIQIEQEVNSDKYDLLLKPFINH